jgi:hypothetical protein
MNMIFFAVIFTGGSRDDFNTTYLLPQIDAVELLTTSAAEGQRIEPLFPMLRPIQLWL